MIKSIVKSTVKSIIKSVLGEGATAIRRYFSQLDSAKSAYLSLDTPFVLTGLSASIKLSIYTSDTTATLTAGSVQGNNEIVIDINGGNVRVLGYAGATLQSIINTGVNISDNILHTVELTIAGTSVNVYIDDTPAGSATWALTGNEDIKYFGRRASGTNLTDGIIADIGLIDTAAGANTQAYKVGEQSANTENSASNSFTLSYNSVAATDREEFELNGSQWDNLAPVNLPAVIPIAAS